MQHVKIYLNESGFDVSDFIPCEVCGVKAVDIHHVTPKSLGGKDEFNNLVALCRDCHDDAHGLQAKGFKISLQQIVLTRKPSKQ